MKELPENPIKQALAKGGTVVGTMIQDTHSPFIVQVLAAAGLDFLLIDMEHGPIGLETASTLIQVARLAGIVPIVRVPDPLYHVMCPLLDAGAMGLMIPRIAGPDQVEKVINFVKYPPWGQRGAVSLKGQSNYHPITMPEFLPKANAEIMVIPQIELRSAVERIDEILAVKGVDVALIGPGDLSVDLGIPGQLQHPTETAAIERVIAACQTRGVPPGIALNDLAMQKQWRDKGMRFLCFSSETAVLLRSYRQIVAELRPGGKE